MVKEITLTALPEALQQIHRPPHKLFCRGDLSALEKPCISIVGTRRMSDYGQYMTEKIVSELACADLVIVSGLAKGIDSVAHQAALDYGLSTIAVLGSGLGQIYPRENQELAEKIVRSGGLILSEYPNNRAPLNHHFPQRNRIVSGLSLATIVIEAPVRSGALITARFALDQSKEIFVIPGDVDRQNSLGTLQLLQKGAAYPISSGYEVLEILKQQPQLPQMAAPQKPKLKLNNNEERVYKTLNKTRPLALQHILQKIPLPTAEVLAILSLLEIKGLVSQKHGSFKRH